ncbi:precorrin-3B C(17)-methyltransferase [Geovibrio thiophilus]|uniref:Precorrin-3B C(17)-methyltransferase n=1 Tax=Geovibrio thiophilus TaxID=139438 RepID=A0A410JZ58_9BACT|nr:precorrin-3B C(17)-methyltransferase [Geovibrio thiophilus]QAR33442.1 precorrin-3B C(17)-methyltransferase [Geovibrio thiophilus]
MAEGRLFVTGTGPGKTDYTAPAALEAIKNADFICGYTPYVDAVNEYISPDAEVFTNGMTGETERVEKAVEAAQAGRNVALVCGGDASLYSLASLVYEKTANTDIIEVIPGITAALSASARLGAPVADDLAIISMSDLLTPWEVIKKRIDAVNAGDFVCAVYNPRSRKRTEQIEHALRVFASRGNLACGYVRNSHRYGETMWAGRLSELNTEDLDMSTVLIIGCKKTIIKNGKLVTPRGYTDKYGE